MEPESVVWPYMKPEINSEREAIEFYFGLSDVERDFYLRQYDANHKAVKYAEKYYAWYHKILIALGKQDTFTPGSKKEIVAFAKNKYDFPGRGFYQAFIEFDINAKNSFVRSLSPKDKNQWKKIIIDISKNDIQVIDYLKDFPN